MSRPLSSKMMGEVWVCWENGMVKKTGMVDAYSKWQDFQNQQLLDAATRFTSKLWRNDVPIALLVSVDHGEFYKYASLKSLFTKKPLN